MDSSQIPSTSKPNPVESFLVHGDKESEEYEEMVVVLQLEGVLDFDAVRRAANMCEIRVRECDTETPLVQV